MKLSTMPYQDEAFYDWDTKVVMVAGGKGSGKTGTMSALKSLATAAVEPGTTQILASPTIGMTYSNVLPLMREMNETLKLKVEGLDLGAPNYLDVSCLQGGTCRIWLNRPIERPHRTVGINASRIFMEEVDEAPWDKCEQFFNEAVAGRLRRPFPGNRGQINITGAPVMNGNLSRLWEICVERGLQCAKWHWSMLDNYTLTDDYKADAVALIPSSHAAGWIRGQFYKNTDDLVYPDLDLTPNEDGKSRTSNWTGLTLRDRAPDETVLACFDLNLGGMSCAFFLERQGCMYLVGEIVKEKDVLTLLTKISQIIPKDKVILTCDPASTQVQPFIRQGGWRNQIMTSAPPVEWRVASMNLAIRAADGTRHLFMNPKAAPVSTRCLAMQTYLAGAPDKKTWVEEAGTDISGPADAVGYAVYLRRPFKARGAPEVKLRGF